LRTQQDITADAAATKMQSTPAAAAATAAAVIEGSLNQRLPSQPPPVRVCPIAAATRSAVTGSLSPGGGGGLGGPR
jgi:hypothetical protein